MPPLLTIAIPTYNRVECLRVLINRLIEEFEELPAWDTHIELIVVNNASTDETSEYLDDLRKNFPVAVFHNSENLGMDGNFIRCFEVARGRWLWLFSDDDLPMMGAVGMILDALSTATEQCAMVYLPTRFQVGSLEDNREKVGKKTIFKCENAHNFAARINGLFTFITCIIANRESFLKHVPHPDLSSLRGSFFAFFEWEFELLKRFETFGYFTDPILLARAENSRGYDFAKVFTQRFNDACMAKLGDRKDLSKIIIDGMRYRHLPKLFYKTRIGRNGNFDFDPFDACKDYVNAYRAGPFYYVVMLPIFKLANPFPKIALFIGRIWGKIWLEWSTRVRALDAPRR